MDNPLNTFQYLYDKARHEIERNATIQQIRAVAAEKRELDQDYKYELKKRAATENRQITLNMASTVSILMKLSNIQPEHWIYDEPAFVTKGIFRKRQVEVGRQEQIALEGWPLPLEQEQEEDLFFSEIGGCTLVLTADENINGHPPLVWYKMPFEGRPVTKNDITPLSPTPLSPDDMPWANPFRKKSPLGTYTDSIHHELFAHITPETPQEEIDRLKNKSNDARLPTSARVDAMLQAALLESRMKADYDLYKKARVERKIQVAIAEVAARHSILSGK